MGQHPVLADTRVNGRVKYHPYKEKSRRFPGKPASSSYCETEGCSEAQHSTQSAATHFRTRLEHGIQSAAAHFRTRLALSCLPILPLRANHLNTHIFS